MMRPSLSLSTARFNELAQSAQSSFVAASTSAQNLLDFFKHSILVDFEQSFLALLHRIIGSSGKPDAQFERLVHFLTEFIVSAAKSQVHTNDNLVEFVLESLSRNLNAQDKHVRHKTCYIISRLLKRVGSDIEISESLIESLSALLLRRMEDKNSRVRVEAINAASTLQNVHDAECPVIGKFKSIILEDPTTEVQNAALRTVAIRADVFSTIMKHSYDSASSLKIIFKILQLKVGFASIPKDSLQVFLSTNSARVESLLLKYVDAEFKLVKDPKSQFEFLEKFAFTKDILEPVVHQVMQILHLTNSLADLISYTTSCMALSRPADFYLGAVFLQRCSRFINSLTEEAASSYDKVLADANYTTSYILKVFMALVQENKAESGSIIELLLQHLCENYDPLDEASTRLVQDRLGHYEYYNNLNQWSSSNPLIFKCFAVVLLDYFGPKMTTSSFNSELSVRVLTNILKLAQFRIDYAQKGQVSTLVFQHVDKTADSLKDRLDLNTDEYMFLLYYCLYNLKFSSASLIKNYEHLHLQNQQESAYMAISDIVVLQALTNCTDAQLLEFYFEQTLKLKDALYATYNSLVKVLEHLPAPQKHTPLCLLLVVVYRGSAAGAVFENFDSLLKEHQQLASLVLQKIRGSTNTRHTRNTPASTTDEPASIARYAQGTDAAKLLGYYKMI